MKTVSLAVVLAVGFLSRAGVAQLLEEKVAKAYSYGAAGGANVAEMVRLLVGEDGKVLVDFGSDRLLVLANTAMHARVKTALKDLSVAPRNVRIEVAFRGSERRTESGASADVRGRLVVGGGGRSTVSIAPRIEDSTDKTTTSSRQELLVASGREGSIFVGEEVPYVDWLMSYGLHHGYVEQRVTWQKVGARLVAEATVLGEGPMIRVRLTPELSGTAGGSPHRVRYANVATEVTVSDGAPMSLGGLDEHREFYSRFLVGVDRSGAQQSLDIVLTARIAQ